MENKIWFRMPAKAWEEVHPIGNGSLGAMVWGGTEEECLGINLDTLWSGTKRDRNNYKAIEHLEDVREKIFAGNYVEAATDIEKYLLGEYTESYLPMGMLQIKVDYLNNQQKEQAYKRELDLEEGIVSVQYKKGEAFYSREYFASYPDQLIVGRFSSDERISLHFGFTSELMTHVEKRERDLVLCGKCPEHVEPSYLESEQPILWGENGIHFKCILKILDTDGTLSYDKEALVIENMTFCEFALSAASGDRENPKRIRSFSSKVFTEEALGEENRYKELKRRHVQDYQSLYKKVSISLGEEKHREEPTDVRLKALKEGREDEGLYALFFQYGRYLLIASSREGTEPANLQGIWNWEMRAPWSSNYTTNINVEMNYWPAQICNLSECMEPYFRLLEELVENGKKTAKIHFGCDGFCVGHNTDYWRGTNPVGVPFQKREATKGSSLYSFFMLSGQWMCQELWKAYAYNKDINFLREKAYPILRESIKFVLDWLVPYKGMYLTCPSTSPENQFVTEKGNSPVSMGTTIDMTIVRENMADFEKAYLQLQQLGYTEITQKDAHIYERMCEIREKLVPYQIGEDGRLLEWIKPFEESEPGHRHISHVYGLFPGEEFRGNEKLREACRKTIEYRIQKGSGHTGWSCAWIANLFAQLGDGEKAYEYMRTLLTRSIYKNMWTSHPPFQIDANFAGITAMANMFVQETDGKVHVLPAIPKQWKKGEVEGLRLRNGKTIRIRWDNDTEWKVQYEIQ